MNKIIITPGITDLNRGDQALIWLIKDLLKEADTKFEYRILESGNNKEDILRQSNQTIKEGFEVISPILLHPARGKGKKNVNYSFFTKISWGIIGLADTLKSMLLLSQVSFINYIGQKFLSERQKDTYKEFIEMDILVIKGGGFLHTYNRLSDLYYLYYGLFNLLLAKKLKKKIIIMPNSFGPFLGEWERMIVKHILSKCDVIYARETLSQQYLSKVINHKVELACDLGFYINEYNKSEYVNKDLLLIKEKKVAITMRPYRFPESNNRKEKYNEYIIEMSKLVKQLIENNYHPVFVAHTLGPSAHEEDMLAINEVISQLQTKNISNTMYTYINDEKMNCFDITNLYNQMDYIIGTRFHSVIFAMTSFTPAIAISYSGHKTVGIMADMGLSDYVVDIADMNADHIFNQFNKLVSQEDEVKNKIRRYIEKCIEEKNRFVNKVQEVLES